MKRIFCILLALIAAISLFSCAGAGVAAGAEKTSWKTGERGYMGFYPQSRVMDENILNELRTRESGLAWRSYRYYHDFAPSDFMEYADVSDVGFKGDRYRAVRFSEYRTIWASVFEGEQLLYQKKSGYYTNKIYWFKFEPICWYVLDGSDPKKTLVLSESILDSQPFDNARSVEYSDNSIEPYFNSYNSWANASVRAWLNDDFYNTAFYTSEQEKIIGANLKTKSTFAKSDSGASETQDKIFLLSQEDAENQDYGFWRVSKFNDGSDVNRIAYGTDYAKCQGLDVYTVYNGNETDGSSAWYLRTPGVNMVADVEPDGLISEIGNPADDSKGIRMAMYIDASSGVLKETPEEVLSRKCETNGGHKFVCEVNEENTLATVKCRICGKESFNWTMGFDDFQFVNSSDDFYKNSIAKDTAKVFEWAQAKIIKKYAPIHSLNSMIPEQDRLKAYSMKPEYDKYYVTPADLYKLMSVANESLQSEILNNIYNSNWNGSCYGMSSIMLIRKILPSALPLSEINSDLNLRDAQCTHDIPKPVDSDSVLSFVNYYQCTYKLIFDANILEICSRMNKLDADYTAGLNDMLDILRKGEPLLFSICQRDNNQTDKHAHAVIAVGIIDETDSSCTLSICDPCSSTLKTMLVHKNRVSQLTHSIDIEYNNCQNSLEEYFSAQEADLYNYNAINVNDEIISPSDGISDYVNAMEKSCWMRLYNTDASIVFLAKKYENDETVTNNENEEKKKINTYYILYRNNGDGAFSDNVYSIVSPYDYLLNGDNTDGNKYREFFIRQGADLNEKFEVALTKEDKSDYISFSVINASTGFYLTTENDAKLTWDPSSKNINFTSDKQGNFSVKYVNDNKGDNKQWDTFAIDCEDASHVEISFSDQGVVVDGDYVNPALTALVTGMNVDSAELPVTDGKVLIKTTENGISVEADGSDVGGKIGNSKKTFADLSKAQFVCIAIIVFCLTVALVSIVILILRRRANGKMKTGRTASASEKRSNYNELSAGSGSGSGYPKPSPSKPVSGTGRGEYNKTYAPPGPGPQPYPAPVAGETANCPAGLSFGPDMPPGVSRVRRGHGNMLMFLDADGQVITTLTESSAIANGWVVR